MGRSREKSFLGTEGSMTRASVGRSTSSNGVNTNTAALRPVRSSAAARSRAVSRSSAPRSPLVVSPSSGGTTTTTSRIRSGGTPARMTLPARVARKLTVSSGSLTQKASGVPGRRRATSSLANVTRADLVVGEERFLAVPRDRRAGEHRERQRRGHDDGERSTPLEPVPHADEPERREDRDREPERHEPVGGQPPRDERERHADEREHEPRAQDPAGVAARRR